jgi:hypothetical protein
MNRAIVCLSMVLATALHGESSGVSGKTITIGFLREAFFGLDWKDAKVATDLWLNRFVEQMGTE